MSDVFASAGWAEGPPGASDELPNDIMPAELRPFPTVDLVALAEAGIPPPELLCSDLLYRGALHSLAGPPDCGKSTLAYWWALHLLANGEAVVLIDEESGREQTVEKLLALGADPRHLERLAYVEFPGRQWDQADILGFARLLQDWKPALVIFDSSAAFLTLAGRDEDRAPDSTWFYKGILLHAARLSGAAVVVLDHIPKDNKTGRYARGSGAKLATVDVALMLDVIIPFSRQQSGLLKLKVTKDRRGYLHRAFEVRVEVEPASMALVFERVESEQEDELAGLGPAAVKVLEALRASTVPLSVRQIIDAVAGRHGHGLKRQTVSTALNDLAGRDLVDCADTGAVGEKYWSAVQGRQP